MKKILSVVVVFVLLVAMSTSAFAAAPTTTKNDDGSYTTAGSDAAYANSMMTILAYTDGAAISVDSIQYIDQTTAAADGSYSFTNYLPKTEPTGTTKYVVKVGGQEIATPLEAGYIEAPVTDVTAAGTVSYTGTTTGATVALYDAADTEVAKVTTAADTGAFSITAPAGTYKLSVTKAGHTRYIVEDVDIATVNGAAYTIYAGDANADDLVGVTDITSVVLALDAEITADNVNVDVNDDAIIGVTDITAVVLNLDKASVLPTVAE